MDLTQVLEVSSGCDVLFCLHSVLMLPWESSMC